MILEAAVIPPHISIQRSAARSEEATQNIPTAPSRHPLQVRRQTATKAAAAHRGTITATSASPGLMVNTDGIDSRSSRNPPHISIQCSGARSKEATIHNTPTEPTRHPLPVRRQTTTAAAAAQRGTITATSASPELIGNTDGQRMKMLLNLPKQQRPILDDQSLKYKR